jgi:hypothetical protein
MLSLCKVTDNNLWVFSFTLGLFSMIDDVNIITTVISPWSCNMTSFEQTAAWQSHSALPLTQQVFRSLVFYAWLFECLSHSAQHRALVFPNASHFKHCHALLCDRLICITCLSTIHLDGKLERSLVSLFSFLYVLLFSSILTDLYRSIKNDDTTLYIELYPNRSVAGKVCTSTEVLICHAAQSETVTLWCCRYSFGCSCF